MFQKKKRFNEVIEDGWFYIVRDANIGIFSYL